MSTKLLTLLVLPFTAVAFAEDFKTINGKEYKNATVTRLEPDGIVVKTTLGVTKVYFSELPKEVQERFHYDPEQAASFSTEQAANYAAYQNQQEEIRRQRADRDAKNHAAAAEQQATVNRVQALQARYVELQQQEDQLLLQIGEAKKPGPEYREGKSRRHRPNPLASQLPLLQNHLSEMRREKTEVRKQLEKTQSKQ